MNAPLSRYLTRFAAEAAVVVAPSPTVAEPLVTMTVADLDARLDDARATARAEAEAVHAAHSAELEEKHASDVTKAVAAARADWCDGTAAELAGTIERAFATLQADLAEATGKALRPLMADAARDRTLAALETLVARLLSDPLRAAITLRAPADLVAALRTRGMPSGISLVAADVPEAVVTCGGTRIETRLAAALADIAGT